MRIGLSAGGTTIDHVLEQARAAEADGFSTLWFAHQVLGDPLVPIAVAGRETERIELATGVVTTYPTHPLAMANRAASVSKAIGRPGFTLGIGPSHESIVRDVLRLSYDGVGSNTEEYVRIVGTLLAGESIDVTGDHWSLRSEGRAATPDHPVPLLLAALGPRLLRVAGELTDGTILWLASARALGDHVVPRITAAAASAGRPAPRIVAGVPVAVHDDVDEARAVQVQAAEMYGSQPNFERMVERGGGGSVADLAVVGDETAVTAQLRRLLDAGATDIHAAVFPVGADRDQRRASLARTRALLASLT